MAVSVPTRSLATAKRHEVRIDASKPLKAEPKTGHNRWHPDIAPILRVQPGDEVILETRDALDGQLTPDSKSSDAGSVNLKDRKSTRLNSSHLGISYAVFCLKKKRT